ncbi:MULTISPECIES: Bug family tripartite tricarboxylate transporter substrate binding protein [Ramlibacter]|uniref:Tripartite tricarboxylate transporter substrate binding protein n=1 Tax=Ramlibacter pinisoli TaxID=2682844 RepID=A0A6N8IXV8_9BURK|nr:MULTISPECIES: tripartite tricarboxylate transporter substrate binding protein [Ramlibacter]MBA2961916.1 tripartite tricarboxylate transporter substrate binding protein [Ramlibacter sp. CGMCC 1.13660]MVQ31859.1 tripartite tricarboxylate transporter substrate binding protein [Ramlibacter pinisoli]
MHKRQSLKLIAGAVFAAAAGYAAAQGAAAPFPSKTITMVVPYAPGGSSDTRARQVAAKMGAILGQSVIVENKPGAAGNIGTDAIAKATPDGHVIGIGNLAPLTVNRSMMPKMPFDPATDLVPIGLIEKGPLVLMVSADKSPFKSFADLAAQAKSKPGTLSYASAGNGGAFHLAGELLEDAIGAPMVHVPYRGGGPATTDLIAGTVGFMFDMVPASLPYTKATPPKARALAVAADKRLPQYPDVPTFAELGIRNFEVSNWFGLVAPKGTPAPVIAKLNDALNRALKDPEIAERITSQGNILGGGTPEQFGQFIVAERARWSKIIQDKKIQAD